MDQNDGYEDEQSELVFSCLKSTGKKLAILIKIIREEVAMRCPASTGIQKCYNSYILPKQGKTLEEKKSMLIDVKLRMYEKEDDADDEEKQQKELIIKLRRDNCYIVGFYSQGIWKEFKEDDKLIENARLLSFTGNYNSLESKANKKILGLTLGKEPLISAVSDLLHSTDERKVSAALMVLILTIPESIRFHTIFDHIVKDYERGVEVTKEMSLMVNEWGKASGYLLDTHNYSNAPQVFPGLDIMVNKLDAIKHLAVLLNVSMMKKLK